MQSPQISIEPLPKTTVTVVGGGTFIEVADQEPSIEVSFIGTQGTPGIGSTITATAAETISASKIVRINAAGEAELAQPDGKGVLGVALNSATVGLPVEIRTGGLHTDAGLNLAAGWQFLTANGSMTASAPSSGWLYRLGYSPSATSLEIVIETPMEL